MKKQINIEGMSCGHCVRHVEEALKEVAGVGTVQVNLQGKNAVVEANDSVTDEALKAAVEEAGYDVTGINAL
jgi:copper ion binding protein